MSRKLALIIGNSEYEDSSLAQLVTPGADVMDLAEVMRNAEVGGFDEVTMLVNQTVTSVRRAIANFFEGRSRDDLLLLYFSGHGIRDDRGQLFLAVKDSEHKLLRGTAIPANYITEEMDNSRSRRQVLILDCCHSGAFSHGMKGTSGVSVGTAAVFEGTGSGRVVLTATDSTQYAWEGDQVLGQAENSVFTHYLIQGLRTGEADSDADGQITLDELYNYVYEQVIHETPKQTPGKWSYGQQGEIIIARNPHPVAKPVELPAELQQTITDPRPWVREGAVHELGRLLRGEHAGLTLSAHEALKRLEHDDSRRVATAARQALTGYERVQLTDGPLDARQAVPESSRGGQTEQGAGVAPEAAVGKSKPRLPRWAIWLGLLLVGVVVIGLMLRWLVPGLALVPPATHIAEVTLSPTASATVEASPPLPSPSIPVIVQGVNTPLALPSATVQSTVTQSVAITARIAFFSDPEGDDEIYIMNADGSGIVKVTDNSANDRYPAWSPDGAKIAFESTRDGNPEIYVMSADGSGQIRLTDAPGGDWYPAWSPDGEHIAYSSQRDGNVEIIVMNADGSGQTLLTQNSVNDWRPAWSPDGQEIAFYSGTVDDFEIYVMASDGSGQTRLTQSAVKDWHLEWLLGRERIAFQPASIGSIMVSLLNIQGWRRVQQPDNPVSDWDPSWSPDGSQIAFTSDRDGNTEVYLMDVDSLEQTRVTQNSAHDTQPVWSPDGEQIAFTSDRDGNYEIYLMNIDGSDQTRLTVNSTDDIGPAWQP